MMIIYRFYRNTIVNRRDKIYSIFSGQDEDGWSVHDVDAHKEHIDQTPRTAFTVSKQILLISWQNFAKLCFIAEKFSNIF